MRGRKAVLVAEKGAQKDGMSREEKRQKSPYCPQNGGEKGVAKRRQQGNRKVAAR